MYRVLDNSCRLFLAATAFTMVFLLTPRAWVGNHIESQPQTIPVDRLEQSGECLWCDRALTDDECTDPSDDDQLWLNPDDPKPRHPSDECKDTSPDDPNA